MSGSRLQRLLQAAQKTAKKFTHSRRRTFPDLSSNAASRTNVRSDAGFRGEIDQDSSVSLEEIRIDEEEGIDELAAISTENDASDLALSANSRRVICALNRQMPSQFLFECNPWRPRSPARCRVWLRRGRVLGLGTKSIYFEVGATEGTDFPYAAKLLLLDNNTVDLARVLSDPDYVEQARTVSEKEISRRMLLEFSVRKLVAEDDPLTLLSKYGLLVPLCWGCVTGLDNDLMPLGKQLAASRFLVIYPRMASSMSELPFDRLSLSAKVVLTTQCLRLMAKFHRLGYAHQDISPENFMLDFEGRVYLRKFRRAGKLGSKPELPSVPENPVYLDCETAIALIRPQEKNVSCTRQRDSWALGITLFTVWCGHLPYGLSELQHGDPERKVRSVALLSFIRPHLEDYYSKSCHPVPEEVRELLWSLLRLRASDRLSPERACSNNALFRSAVGDVKANNGLPRSTPRGLGFPARELLVFRGF
ncbi:rhoptry kinase family protein rop32 [Cystoisospora suis]|uniref:Rhoptry kinase family protein rop32 n=1 Tax=Cystoisospora suis TaxID=483139 RepID=A0A2C6KIL6_9APIC|nr:rhoptry kinase family protein rop32 [Cystoisospora suis]